MTCRFCCEDAIAEHPEHGPVCREHAIAVALTRGMTDGPKARAALYEQAAVGRLELYDENGPGFTTTQAGLAWALEEVAAWPAA